MSELRITMPEKLENLQLPDPSLLTFYNNLEERTIWMDFEVDVEFLEFARYIINWNREDKNKPIEERKPIKLMFFSPGGSLSVNNAMIDIIKSSKTPIYGFNIGEASSAGCFIFMACHKRFAMPKAVFLLHKGSGDFSGSYDEVISQVVEYQRQIEELATFVLENSKITQDILDENLGTEWYVSAEKALEYGIIDAIITDIDDLI